jgi:hypothetical protein
MSNSALTYALRSVHVPIRETLGKNRSPQIDEINRFVGNKLGAPYCAAGVSRDFDLAGCENFPSSGSSQAIMRWFKKNGWLFTDPQHLLKCKGALFGWTNADGAHGHIGFVKGRLTVKLTKKPVVVGIQTVEYNTSLSTGDRDGEGCFELQRATPKDRGHTLWFCDTSHLVGGVSW